MIYAQTFLPCCVVGSMRGFWGALGLMAAFIGAALPVHAQNPVPFVNPQQLQIPATGADFNNLINSIDSVLNPLLPVISPSNLTATGGISLSKGTSSSSPVIGTYSTTGATSVSLKIEPLGNGKIILFASNMSPASTGVIKVANSPSWIKAPGLAACPGGIKAFPTPNGSTSGTITGYLVIEDWMSAYHAVPTC